MRHRPSRIEWTGWAAASILLHAAAVCLAVWGACAARGCAPAPTTTTAGDRDLIAAETRR